MTEDEIAIALLSSYIALAKAEKLDLNKTLEIVQKVDRRVIDGLLEHFGATDKTDTEALKKRVDELLKDTKC